MNIFLFLALIIAAVFVALAGVVFVLLLRWINLIVASWSGPWFPPPPALKFRETNFGKKRKEEREAVRL